MLFKLLQLEKAYSPIDSTSSPISTDVIPKQPEKAAFPMEETPSGMDTLVRLLQLIKAKSEMLVTL